MRIESALTPPPLQWECPNCDTRYVGATKRTPFHACRGMYDLTAPLVPQGTRCKVEAKVREDYVGREDVTYANGLPIMSVITTRDDGQDCAAYAPCARASVE